MGGGPFENDLQEHQHRDHQEFPEAHSSGDARVCKKIKKFLPKTLKIKPDTDWLGFVILRFHQVTY